MKKVYVVKKKSVKKNVDYVMMYIDMGYKELAISFTDTLIAEICGVSVNALYALPYDEPKQYAVIKVGE